MAFRDHLVGAVPGAPEDFQSRPGLLAALDNAGPGVSVLHAVAGTPGVGKTQLAAEYSRARLAQGWRLVAWINAADAGTLLAGLAATAAAAGLPGDAVRDAADAGRVVRHRLETDGDRCLIVFDDVFDHALLRPFLPGGGAARVLLISDRHPTGNQGTSIPVDVFTAEEALAFLAGRTGQADTAGAAAVAAELGYLPLALAQAAAVIARQRLAYRSYLELLRTAEADQRLVPRQGPPQAHGAAEAVLLSLDAVRAGDQTGLCTGVLEVMAVLSAAGVRRDMLHAAGRAGVLASAGGAGGGGAAAELVDQAVGQLTARSLLTVTVDGGTIIAHRLVMQVARDLLARQGHLTAVCRAAASVLDARAQALKGSSDRLAVRDIPVQVTALLDSTPRPAGTGADAEELARVLLSLRLWALYHLNELGDSAARAIAVGEPLTADLERAAGPDHPDTLASRDSLATAYADAGRAGEAIPLFEQTLAARQRALGPDHPDTLTSRNNLATAYRDAARAGEAIPLQEQALAACERVLGPEHPDTLTSRDNLATAYWAAGRVAQAIPLFEQTLAARQRALGSDHPGTLTSRNNLAAANWAAGRVAQAIALHEQTLAARERVLGPDHPDTLTSRNNLAAAYADAGRVDEAVPLFEQTLAARERVLGPGHSRTLTSRNNLAIARKRSAR